MAPEPALCAVEVLLVDAQIPAQPQYQRPACAAGEQVQQARADHRAGRGRRNRPDQVEVAAADLKPGEWENQLGRDRGEDVLDGHEHDEAGVPQFLDEVAGQLVDRRRHGREALGGRCRTGGDACNERP